MTLSGFAFGFSRGWSFSFVLLAIFPVITVATSLMTKVLISGFVANMIAYQ